ncbi:MAG: hypothetical protein CO189_03855, partial [candidate division Zixibacteria bacterium CG_4_9_14_3_um_filter_46_8]
TEGLLPFARWIADEANEAGRIKTERPVMVILGNPPYSGHSANKGDWIRKLLRGEDTSTGEKTDNYFEVDGKPLGERNPKWLNDDYVKFIRFAQWRIQKTGYGVLAFISNHGYLDNPTFRGMRQSLMESSDDIYVLDLHGNSKKKEKCPDGSQDENVFDIQQGVAIGIFVKRAGGSATPTRDACQSDSATVRHIHLWGLREVFGKNFHDQKQLTAGKSSWLYENDISTGNWTTIKPQSPSYLFVPRDTKLLEEYQAYWKIGDAMPENNVGFVTARDRFVTDFDRDSLERRIKEFRSEESNISSSELSSKYALKNTSSWNLGTARRLLRADGNWEHHFRMCLYRPFDSRHIYYSRIMLERPVHQIQMIGSGNWDIIFCSSHIVEFNLFRRGGNAMFPLYLYSQREKGDLLDASEPTDTPGGRRPNLSPEFIEEFSKKLGMTFVPDGKGDPGAAGNAAVSAAVLKASRLQNGGRDALHTASETLAVQGDSCNAAVSAAVSGASRPSFGQVEIRDRGRLPHWEIEGGIYFITFRLADSLPQSVLKAIIAEREDILKTARQAGREVSKAERARLAKLTSKKIERYLDSGAGACHLRNDKVAEVVADAIRHFDGKYYRLFAWTVMPNHVHIVVKLLPDHNLQKTLHSCKSFTSHQANLILGRKGIFWSREYYDHLVRDEEEFYRVVRYVANNPKKANLKDWKWCWVDEKWGQDAPNTASGTLALQNGGQDAPNTASETLALPGGRDALETASETLAVQGTFGPEDIFHYIYAVFHSPTYRSRYAEFLKIDFPRVPLTSNQTLFRTLCGLGKELVDLHLMEKHGPDLAGYPVDGSHQVEKVRYSEPGKCSAGGRVWINDAQYFGNVSPEVWEFHIGGYQVCQKWLKDRKGRTLSYDDQTHYQYIVSALSETIRIMSEIDQAIDQHGGWPIR